MKVYLSIIIATFLVPLISAQYGYNNPQIPRVASQTPVLTTSVNNNTVNVNNSNCWQGLCNPNVFVEVAGDTMTGPLNISTASNVENLRITHAGFTGGLDKFVSYYFGASEIFWTGLALGIPAFIAGPDQQFCFGADDLNQRFCIYDTTASGSNSGSMAYVANNFIDYYAGDLFVEGLIYRVNRTGTTNFLPHYMNGNDIIAFRGATGNAIRVASVNSSLGNISLLALQNITTNVTTQTILPSIDSTYELGNKTNRWRSGHIINLTTGDLNFVNDLVFIERGNDLCLYNQGRSLKFCMNADGSIMQNTTGPKPICNIANRGKTWITFGGPGVADTQEVCLKNNQEQYGWVASVSTGVITP